MDYDVAAVGLSVPPAAASLTTYRPAISVKNNGRFDAVASGTLSAYKAGLRVWSSPVSSNSIEPGETGLAIAQDDWTPDTEGTYVFFGYVSTYKDQVEPNNNLAPVTITIGPEPPPPPPPVTAHASQHEHGGSDVLDVDDLPGQLRDEQRPEPHASQHQAGGNDQLNVAGLAGILGDPQTPVEHGNAHHTEQFTTQDELDNHAGAAAAHTAATNLANRETSGLDAGLVPTVQLALGSEVTDGRKFLERGDNPGDRYWSVPVPQGLICVWPSATAIPTGWTPTVIIPTPDIAHLWILKL
jgi:hypothetical protein